MIEDEFLNLFAKRLTQKVNNIQEVFPSCEDYISFSHQANEKRIHTRHEISSSRKWSIRDTKKLLCTKPTSSNTLKIRPSTKKRQEKVIKNTQTMKHAYQNKNKKQTERTPTHCLFIKFHHRINATQIQRGNLHFPWWKKERTSKGSLPPPNPSSRSKKTEETKPPHSNTEQWERPNAMVIYTQPRIQMMVSKWVRVRVQSSSARAKPVKAVNGVAGLVQSDRQVGIHTT